MKDYIALGPTPCDEPCAQVGTPNYRQLSEQECRRYIKLIRAALGLEPEGAHLSTKSFPHDYGTYYEVVCYFDDDLPESLEYALKCESEAPTTWEGTY